MTHKIILIKIGGSLITDKTKPFSLRKDNVSVIINEIAHLFNQADFKIILGHGSGSFGHSVANQYQTQDGLDPMNQDQVLGMTQVKAAAAYLNQLIIQRLLDKSIPTVSLHPNSFMFAEGKKPTMAFWQNLNHLLDLPVLPVVYGDVVFDRLLGATIFSTETVLTEIAKLLTGQGYKVIIVHCGAVSGVYDQKGKTIPLITPSNFSQVRSVITGSAGIDVTGGMIHKVKTSLKLARLGVVSYITNGAVRGGLRHLLLDGVIDKTTVIRNV